MGFLTKTLSNLYELWPVQVLPVLISKTYRFGYKETKRKSYESDYKRVSEDNTYVIAYGLYVMTYVCDGI